MRTQRIISAMGVALVLGACQAFDFDVLSPAQSAALIKSVQVGMSRSEVEAQFGPPHGTEVHGSTEFLFYKTVWHVAAEAKQRNPIAVRDGKVVGLGEAYLRSFTNSAASWGGWIGAVSSESPVSN